MTSSTAFEGDLTASPRWGGRAVLALSVSLAVVEVGRFATFSDAKQTMIAALATVAYLPVHLWHLSYGLRGERPPRSVPTLCWIGLVHASALLALGPTWSFSLAALATSALVVLRPRWSFVVLLGCLSGPVVAYAIHPDLSGALGGHVFYLVLAVAFRALLQFSVVWLVAATYQLATARGVLAEQAAAYERTRVNHLVREALERNLAALSRAAQKAKRLLEAGDIAAAQESLREAGALSRATLGTARRIVSSERRRDASPVSAPTVPDTPIMAGVPRDRVVTPFVIVHLTVLGYLLLHFLGLSTASGEPKSTTLAFLAWLLLAVLQVYVSSAVARGAVLRHRLLIWAAVLGVCVAERSLGDEGTTNLGWWIAASTAIGLWGHSRWGYGALTLAVVGLFVVDLAPFLDVESMSAQELEVSVWYLPYMAAIAALVVAGLVGVSLLVRRVDDLTQLLSVSSRAAADAERLRASRDVHDLLSQNFSAIALKCDLAIRQLAAGDVARAEHQVSEVAALASEQEDRLRRASEGFADTSVLHELSTATAILRLAGVEVSSSVGAGIGDLASQTDTVLGRVVREATTNVLRHARARQVETRLVEGPSGIVLEIRNDGAARPREWGSGLMGLAESVEGIGGSFEATSHPDRTFAVTVTVPASG